MSTRINKYVHSLAIGLNNPPDVYLQWFLFTVVPLIYITAIGFEYVNWDDPIFLYDNVYVQSVVTIEGLKWVLTTKLHGMLHPLTWISFILETQVAGFKSAIAQTASVCWQCGFKAIGSDEASYLTPIVKDNNWCFDSEPLVPGYHRGFKLAEVPVRRIDDSNSRVKTLHTSAPYVFGLLRLPNNTVRRSNGGFL